MVPSKNWMFFEIYFPCGRLAARRVSILLSMYSFEDICKVLIFFLKKLRYSSGWGERIDTSFIKSNVCVYVVLYFTKLLSVRKLVFYIAAIFSAFNACTCGMHNQLLNIVIQTHRHPSRKLFCFEIEILKIKKIPSLNLRRK